MASQGPVNENTKLADLIGLLAKYRKENFQLQKDNDEIKKKHNERIVTLKEILKCENGVLEECLINALFPSEGTSSSEDEEHDDSSEDISYSDDESDSSEKSNDCWEKFDEVSGEYNKITDQIIDNKWCKKTESFVQCLQRTSEEYDKLNEQSRSLSKENTGLLQENIVLKTKLREEERKLRKKGRECEGVERKRKAQEKIRTEDQKLKGELKELLGCRDKELIPCAKNYIEEHRSTKEKNEQLKSQLRLASDKFKCKNGEAPENCFERKSIIDTIDLEEQQKQIDLLRAKSEEYATVALKERDRYNKDIETLKKLLECKNSEEFNGEDLGDCAERKMSELHDLLEENKKLRDTNGTLTRRGYKFAPPHPPTNPPTSATSRTAKTNNKYYSANSLAGARFPPFNTRAWAGFTL